jgi:hypothetical protein
VTLPVNVTFPVTIKEEDIVTGPVILPPEELNLVLELLNAPNALFNAVLA